MKDKVGGFSYENKWIFVSPYWKRTSLFIFAMFFSLSMFFPSNVLSSLSQSVPLKIFSPQKVFPFFSQCFSLIFFLSMFSPFNVFPS